MTLRVRYEQQGHAWTWTLLDEEEKVLARSSNPLGSEAGARWDARRTLAFALQDAGRLDSRS